MLFVVTGGGGHSLFGVVMFCKVSAPTGGVGADGPVDPVLSLELYGKWSRMISSIQVYDIQMGRKGVAVAQTGFPLLDQRSVIVHIQ